MDAKLPPAPLPASIEMADAMTETLQPLILLLASGQPLYHICKQSGLETYAYDPELHRGWTALENSPFPLRFDWPQWQAEAKALEEEPGLITQADLLTLRKLLTCYLRQERFVAGTLAQIVENGQLLRILQRLTVLHRLNQS